MDGAATADDAVTMVPVAVEIGRGVHVVVVAVFVAVIVDVVFRRTWR